MSNERFQIFQTQFALSIASDLETQDLLDDIIPAGSLITSQAAIEVHKKGYYARLTEALGETFEGSWFAMGDELFFSICEEYIREHRSEEYNLSNYGNDFPAFIESKKEMIAIDFIHDMARFDWEFKELFHEKQHISISNEELAILQSNPYVGLIFGNAVRLFKSNFSIYKVWKQRKNDLDGESSVINYNQEENLLIYKKDDEIYIKILTGFQFNLLRSLEDGKLVSDIFDDLSIENKDEIIDLFQIIGSTGIVTKFT